MPKNVLLVFIKDKTKISISTSKEARNRKKWHDDIQVNNIQQNANMQNVMSCCFIVLLAVLMLNVVAYSVILLSIILFRGIF